jgi:hypothetical protein
MVYLPARQFDGALQSTLKQLALQIRKNVHQVCNEASMPVIDMGGLGVPTIRMVRLLWSLVLGIAPSDVLVDSQDRRPLVNRTV